jgi:predicted glycosyltransferase
MRILFDVGHPAHVHLFKNLIFGLSARGHECLVSAREKDVTIELLKHYGIPHISLGGHYKHLYGKAYGLAKIEQKLLRLCKEFKPDTVVSHGSVYAAFVSAMLLKPHISMEDTGNMEQIMLYRPFTKVILTPSCFGRRLGVKHIRYKGYHELAYLHPSYFKPDTHMSKLRTRRLQRYVLFRFVSWRATHDVGLQRIGAKEKVQLVHKMADHAKVFVSSENSLPDELRPFRIEHSAADLHHIIKRASVVVSEGAKVAAESAIMGIPSIYVNARPTSYTEELRSRYHLLWCVSNKQHILEKVVSLIKQEDLKKVFAERVNTLLREKIDVTKFLLWFIENYPESARTMMANPDYDMKFRTPMEVR